MSASPGEKTGSPKLVIAGAPRAKSQQDEFSALIVASARGDRAAFRKLYLDTSPKLLGLVFRIIKSRTEAEEIVQEVYFSVWTRAHTFSPESGTALGWLASIARNRAIDFVRSRSPAALETSDIDSLETIAAVRDLEAEIMDRTALADCLSVLDQPVRDMILLAYIEGASREELSLRFGSPVSTIKTWLHRGLASLRACLDQKK